MDSTWVILIAWGYVFSGAPIPEGDMIAPIAAQEAIREVAFQFDLCGNRDCYVTLTALRGCLDIVVGAPPSWVVRNLPAKEYLTHERDFSYAHFRWVQNQREHSSDWRWGMWERRAFDLSEAYWALEAAKRMEKEPWNCAAMRFQLRKAVDILGADAVYSGCLPSPVPLEFFRRLR